MRSRFPHVAIAAVAAVALWVVPSVGSQGQGTFGDRFAHSDRALFARDKAAEPLLKSADRQTARAVIAL